MTFPVGAAINSTTGFILQKSKPVNDYEKLLEELNFLVMTRKRILATKNTPERKQQLRELGLKQSKVQIKIHRIKEMLNQHKRFDLCQCFTEICKQKMQPEEFSKIWEQAHILSDALKQQEQIKGENE